MSYDDSDIMRSTDTMGAFFSGKLKNEITNLKKEPQMVELGHGTGIGHKDGTYSEYVKNLREQASKGNGVIYIGKSINTEKTLSIPENDQTDTFALGDLPKLLIMFYNVINPVQIKVTWKDSNNESILEQFYEVPSAYGMSYDWWDSYGTYFIGPDDLETGEYKIEITSKEFGIEDKTKVLKTSIKFSVEDSE